MKSRKRDKPRRPSPGDPFEYYDRLNRVRDFVSHNISRPISLAMVADVAGLERKYFSVYFKKRAGISFSHWLRGERVRIAKALFRARNYSVTQVAGLVGYEYLTTFERAFRAETGLAPSAFKRRAGPLR